MRRGKGGLPTTGGPGLVVARRLGAATLSQGRPARTMSPRRTGQVRPMRFLPRIGFGLVLRRRHIDGVMQPAVPARRYCRSLGDTVVDDPAPIKTERRINLAVFCAVIAIAEFVVADKFAVEPSRQLRAEGLTIPPGKKAKQKAFHCVLLGKPWPTVA